MGNAKKIRIAKRHADRSVFGFVLKPSAFRINPPDETR